MIFIYELDSYSLEIYRMCKYELPKSRLSKVIVWQTDRQTDRQTRPKLYTTLRGWLHMFVYLPIGYEAVVDTVLLIQLIRHRS